MPSTIGCPCYQCKENYKRLKFFPVATFNGCLAIPMSTVRKPKCGLNLTLIPFIQLSFFPLRHSYKFLLKRWQVSAHLAAIS